MTSPMKLAGRKALVTGAARGIGRATALALAGHGYDLFASYKGQLEPLTNLPQGDVGRNAFAFHREKLPGRLRVAERSPVAAYSRSSL